MKWILIVIIALALMFGVDAYGYTVRKGDTLSGIARRMLGEADRWPYLAELNGLDVEWRDDIAYVWIKPGQEILLEPKMSKEQQMYEVRMELWDIMVDNFVARHGHKYTATLNRGWALDRSLPTFEILKRLEWVDMVEIFMAISDAGETPDEVLMLAAACSIESDFRNILGAHGEIGPMQILMVHDPPMNPAENVRRGWELLNEWGGPTRKGFKRYNGGDDHFPKVIERYNRYRMRYKRRIT